MSKVDANHSSSVHVNHEVGQMSVSDAEYVVTDAQLSMCHCELLTQSVERLTADAQTTIHAPPVSDTNNTNTRQLNWLDATV